MNAIYSGCAGKGETMGYYLFDFDGTLVDSMPVFAAAMVRVIREEGVPYPEDIVKIVTPLGINGGAK